MNMHSLKAALGEKAAALGFDQCAVTTAYPPASGPQLDRALAEGRHADMGWLARNADKRKDPALVLPGARSVVMLALNYAWLEAGNVDDSMGPVSLGKSTEKELPDEVQGEPNGTLTGVVARYARHRDYHHILRPRLKELASWLDAAGGPGTRSLWYVDTGPVLERDLGQRAGIGFVGKHTNLISRQLGNWFLLSEILTTATLEPDEPGRNHCGSCTRCLSACPTDALPAPFTLDARRCISYLTIEHRGDIPESLRPAIGNRIFGCDDCLAVCPWNRFARESALMRESRRAAFDSPDLISWLELDEAQFFALFAGTPIYRTKRNGLRRNICVALGNSGDMRALPALSRAAQDPDEMVARHARWAMAQIETSN